MAASSKSKTASATAPKSKGTPKVPHPPIAADMGTWVSRTSGSNYRRRIKRSVQLVTTYRLLLNPGARAKLSRQERNALHYFADVATVDETRRSRSRSSDGGGGGETMTHTDPRGFDGAPKDSVKY